MGHVVARRDGTDWHLEDVATLDAALERVEHLRNEDAEADVRLFEELALEVRTYVRVALATDPPAPAAAAQEAHVATAPEPEAPAVDAPPTAPVDVAPPAEPSSDDAAPTGRDASAELDPVLELDAPVWDTAGRTGPASHAATDAHDAPPPAADEVPVEVPAPAVRPPLSTPTIHDVVRGVEGVAAQRAEPASLAPASVPEPAAAPEVPLPGAFPLGAPPVAAVAAPADDAEEAAPARRGPRFGRER